MNFSTSSLSAEISNIINSGENKVHGYFYCTIMVKGKIIRPLKIVNIDIYKDFLNNYCDEIMVELYLNSGVYENDILPYKENIEIKIFTKPFSENTLAEDMSQDLNIIQGRGVLTDKNNQFFSNQTSANSKDKRDLMSVQSVFFQMVNPLLERFRMQSTGGIFRLTNGIDLVRTLLMNVSNANEVDQEYKVKGVDIAPNFNAEVKDHINIPHGTKILNVADYINKNAEGIYPTGLGFYLQKDIWYIYPTFDVERFNNATRTLTIIRTPTDVLPLTDRTFLNTKTSLTIIANKDANLIDTSDIDQQNEGNGLRFTDARIMVDDFVQVDGNKATASRGKNVSEFLQEKRETSLNNIVSPGSKITSNMYYEMSKLAKRNGSTIDITWEYSDSSLLYPGMPVRIMTHQGAGPIAIYGVLLAAHEMIMLEGKGMNTSKHKRSCSLSIFIKRKMKWNEETSEEVTY